MYFIEKIWSLTIEMSPFLLFGFIVSGLLSVLLTVEMVTKYLGKNNFQSIFKASLFGIPLPLCSCGVIPVFSYLRKHGASKAATTSFLISTPQTGVDSILVTYGLLGPIFAIFRPIIALFSGIIGGFLVSIFDKEKKLKNIENECDEECCDDKESYLYRIFNYGFVKLPQDIATPLIIGIFSASLIYFFIPEDYFMSVGTGILGMLIMLLIGLPSYICATASVPIALALHIKGFSMGALIVFLMSGPATNIATISVAVKQIGKKSTMIYLFSIMLCSIIAGLCFDFFFPGLQVEETLSHHMHMESNLFNQISGVILVGILINSYFQSYLSSKKSRLAVGKYSLYINGMTCNHCVNSISKTLNSIPHVNVLSIDLKTGKAEINCSKQDLGKIENAIIELGFKIIKL